VKALGLFVIAGVLMSGPSAAVGDLARQPQPTMTEHVPSDLDEIDFVITCDPYPPAADYLAETYSGLPDTNPYVVERGADQGLVHLMNEHGRRVRHYRIPRGEIRAIVRVQYDMTVLDRADLVFTNNAVVLVHTATANAGIFTDSDVYRLGYQDGRVVDAAHLVRDPSLEKMLALGIAFYRRCVPATRG
jgi:hypothetical protein